MHVKMSLDFSLAVVLVVCCFAPSTSGMYYGIGNVVSSLNSIITSPAACVLRTIGIKGDNGNVVKAEEVLDTAVTLSNVPEKSEQVSQLLNCFNLTVFRDALSNSLAVVEMCRLGNLSENFAVCKESVVKVLKANDYMLLRMLATLYLGSVSTALVDNKLVRDLLTYALKYFTEEKEKIESVEDTEKLAQVLNTVNQALTKVDDKNTTIMEEYCNPLSYVNSDSLKKTCTRVVSDKLGVEEATINCYTEQLEKVYPSFLSKTLETLGLKSTPSVTEKGESSGTSGLEIVPYTGTVKSESEPAK